jgi:glycosyltransferase involved in cell wall biosynthesis
MRNRYRILLLTSSYPSASEGPTAFAGVFVQDFARELAKTTQVTVLTQQTDHGPSNLKEESIQVIRFHWAGGEVPLSTLRFPKDAIPISSVIFRGLMASLGLARRSNIDLALACWAIPSGLWALFLKWLHGIDYAVWCLGSDIWEYGKGPLKRALLRLILRKARTIYADGYKLKEDVELLSGKKCHFMSTSRCLPGKVSAKAEIPAEKRNYLFIGRYHPNKGPDVLMEAIAALVPTVRTRVYFHFFGVGPLRGALEQFTVKKRISDVVSLRGRIDESGAVAYLRACAALIIPSRIESIPVVLSDALQAGCPVIVTDVGDMGHLVRKHGAGIVVPPESPEEMAKAIEHDVLHEEDFSEGRRRLLGLFDLSEAVERFIADHF